MTLRLPNPEPWLITLLSFCSMAHIESLKYKYSSDYKTTRYSGSSIFQNKKQ